jgi:hypothetical protein
MKQQDFEQKLSEVERLLNDPDVELEPSRVWSLLDEVARQNAGRGSPATR